MRNSAENADDPQQLTRKRLERKAHDGISQRSAGNAEYKRRNAACEHAAHGYAYKQNKPCFAPAEHDHRYKRDNIGKPELDAGIGAGICASMTKTISEAAVNMAMSASFLVLGIYVAPFDLNGKLVGQTYYRDSGFADLALRHANMVAAIGIYDAYPVVLYV